MAQVTIKQLSSELTALPGTPVEDWDTIENLTSGVLTVVVAEEVTVGKARIFRRVEAIPAVEILPGEISDSITLDPGQQAFILDTYNGGMASTADKLYA